MLNLPTTSDQLDTPVESAADAHQVIENQTLQFTSAELDDMVIKASVAGSPCFAREEFLATPHVGFFLTVLLISLGV